MKRLHFILACVASVLLVAAVAYASGGEAGGEHHALPWGNYAYRMINLALFLFLIWKLAGAKIAGFLKGRQADVKQGLDDLQVRQAEAEKKLKEVERSIANLEQEKQAILAEAKQQGEALRQAILEKAQGDAERMREQAKRSAENEAKAAIDKMRAEMADLVVAAAAKNIQEKLTEKDHEKLVDDYLTKVVLN